MGLKVMHLIDSGGLYGAENMLLDLVEEQVTAGMEPLIVSSGDRGVPEKPLEKEARLRGLSVEAIRIRKGLNPLVTLGLLREARRSGVGILHSHGYKFDINLGIIPGRIRGIPVITTIHGHVTAQPFSRMAVYQWLDKLLIKGFQRVVFVNASMLEQPFFRKRTFRRSVVINNGINISRQIERLEKQAQYSPEEEISRFIGGAAPLIGTVTRLSKGKGVQDLILAFSRVAASYRDARLLVVGDGYHRSELEDLVRRKGLEGRVRMIGYSDMVGYYLSVMDIFVLPSHSEGLPMVLLEAMIAGKLILATSVGGIPEVLKQGQLGFLVRPEHPDEMADSLLGLCGELSGGNDFHAIRNDLRGEVEARYSNRQMAQAYENLYRNLSRHAGGSA